MVQLALTLERYHELTYAYPYQGRSHRFGQQLDDLLPLGLPSVRFRLTASSGLGLLDSLPLELLRPILYDLDVETLEHFRLVNRRALQVVEFIPEYHAIRIHCPQAIRCILGIGTGRWYTLSVLYEKLCTPTCAKCGQFGNYLYLITCRRVCRHCFTSSKVYCPMRTEHAKDNFGLNNKAVASLPYMRARRGEYGPGRWMNVYAPTLICQPSQKPPLLVDFAMARRAGIALHGSESAMEEYVSEKKARKLHAFDEKKAAIESKGGKSRTRRPGSGERVDDGYRNPLRYVAIVRVPWLNPETREAEWGRVCSGCTYNQLCVVHRCSHTVYSKVMFERHLEQCGEIVDGQHERLGRLIPILPNEAVPTDWRL